MQQVGIKGEVKLAEWIRGSLAAWTQKYNKKSFSYGNSRGHSLEQWRTFMRQCNVLGIVKYDLRSMIKGSGHYSVMGVYTPLESCQVYISNDKSLMLPAFKHSLEDTSRTLSSNTSVAESSKRKKRLGKGCNILPIVRNLLADQENWKSVTDKRDYQFLGSSKDPTADQYLYYIPEWKSLKQAPGSDPHFLWSDIQLSKGVLNKDRMIDVSIGDKTEKLYYRSAPCLGVKTCPEVGCDYVAPIRERRSCKNHPQCKLQRSESACPVEFVYNMYPVEHQTDGRRWIGGIVRNQKSSSSNLHNHPLHGSNKICSLVQDKICNAIQANPSLTPTDISLGTGIGFIPSAIDTASAHQGKVAREIVKKKTALGLKDKHWSPCCLEEAITAIDDDDNQNCHDANQEEEYKKYGRPYLVSSGIENGINYSVTMSPGYYQMHCFCKLTSHTMKMRTTHTYLMQLHLMMSQWTGW